MKSSDRKHCSALLLRLLFVFVITLSGFGKVFAQTNSDCMLCHFDKYIKSTHRGDSAYVFVDVKKFMRSAHAKLKCISCHKGARGEFPHPIKLNKVNCFSCHEKDFKESEKINFHFEIRDIVQSSGNKCIVCHKTHDIKPIPLAIKRDAETCETCHLHKNYQLLVKESVHNRLTCINCHGLVENNFRSHIKDAEEYKAANCYRCHVEVAKEHEASVHGDTSNIGNNDPAKCWDCHGTHDIMEMSESKKLTHPDNLNKTCGKCHTNYPVSYFDSIKHGHNLTISDKPKYIIPAINKIKGSCISCHKDAEEEFTGFSSSNIEYEKKQYPDFFIIYKLLIVFLAIVTLGFGIHAFLWRWREKRELVEYTLNQKLIQRFSKRQVISHILLIVSFLLLALSGMLYKLPNISRTESALNTIGIFHKVGILMIFLLFIYHLFSLRKQKRTQKKRIGKFIFGKNSLMFNKQDVRDISGTVRWLIGREEKPKYGRWTYWEKNDYFSAFFGVIIIGFTGIALWIPEIFKGLFSCESFSFIQLIHSHVSPIIVVSILLIHFFNTHLRPKSSMRNTVILTGYSFEEDYKTERQKVNQESDETEKINTKQPSKHKVKIARIIGIVFDAVLVISIALIIYSLLV